MRQCLAVLSMILASSLLLAQKTQLDSLKWLADHSESDSVLNEAYYQLSFKMCNAAPDSGLYYGRKALSIAHQHAWSEREAKAYSQIAYSYYVKSQIDSAVGHWEKAVIIYSKLDSLARVSQLYKNMAGTVIHDGAYEKAQEYLEKAEVIAQQLDDLSLLAGIYMNYGLIDDYKGNYDKAYQYYRQALNYADSTGDVSSRMLVLNNIGVMFYYMGDYRKAIPYFHQIIPYWKKKNHLQDVSFAYKNLGVCYDLLEQNDSSLYYHQQALEMDKQLNDLNEQGKDYHNIGILLKKQKLYEQALEHFERAVTLKKEGGVDRSLATTYIHLVETYLLLGKYIKAEDYLYQAERLAKSYQSKEELKEVYEYWARLAGAQGAYKQANEYLRLYQSYKDSLYELNKVEAIHAIEEEYQAAQKEQENELLRKEKALQKARISQQNTYIGLGILLLIMAGGVLYVLYRRLSKKEQLNKILARQNDQVSTLLKSIGHQTKGQLNMATALLSIQKSMAKDKRTRIALQDSENWFRALTTINKYMYYDGANSSDLLKKSLKEIAENLSFTNERLLNKKTTIQVDVPLVEMEAEEVVWIAIIVNELITNSFKYAFDKTDQPSIFLHVEVKGDDDVVLKYRDNGVGMKAHSATDGGDGLSILRDMVDQLNGNYEINVTSGFQFYATFPKIAA
jgi:two-component sensor histidine kinase/Flp pilus assembly protein TadD